MSAAAATADAPPPKGKKKLLIIVGAAVLVVVLAVVALLMMKKSAPADDEEAAEQTAPAKAAVKHDPKAVPTFVPLDPFTVNLADRDAERYAQVGITLEVGDTATGDQIKAYMPAIRNNILLVLAEKTAAQMMDREGKVKLAGQIQRETSRAMGYEVEEPEEDAADDEAPKKKKRKKAAAPALPVTGVHFSNFIIQ
ncbi:flagellar basal body-associated FliL family protein [Rubrivivax sp. RP6-9]|uniref:flagellar basal body-associated FliL family protein n=1 Tax=Rubrivivax sp. RP6-9 TaxID=3415750 RepID=UPI003CC57D79